MPLIGIVSRLTTHKDLIMRLTLARRCLPLAFQLRCRQRRSVLESGTKGWRGFTRIGAR